MLYLEFVRSFASLRFQKIPLPLLNNFYQYLDDQVKAEMESPNFHTYESVSFENRNLQPEFEKWLAPLRSPITSKHKEGKLLLNFDHLRFQPETFIKFPRDRTLMVTRWKTKEVYGIPTVSFPEPEENLSKIIESYQEKAKRLFNKFSSHPVFSRKSFQDIFLWDISRMIYCIWKSYYIFQNYPISGVLVGTTEEMMCRTLVLVASQYGIPSYCLQHGLILGEEAYVPAFATYYFVYGKYEKNFYIEKGVAPERIIITGHPRYDSIFTSTYTNKSEIIRRAGLNPNKKTILLATQPQHTQFYINLTQELLKNRHVQIIIKPHPWEKAKNRINSYLLLAKKHRQVAVITNEISLYQLIESVDLVVVVNSTVGLEAMLLDKPVLVFKPTYLNRNYPYFDALEDYVYTTTEEIAEGILELLSTPLFQEKAKEIRDQFLRENYPIHQSMVLIQRTIEELNKQQ